MTHPTDPIPLSFVAFDLETTGLNPVEHKIIEFGAVKVVDGQLVDGFDRLVDPQTDIPYHVTQLTGITQADVKGAQLIGPVLNEFLDFIEDLPLVAHNAPFDVSFIEQNLKYLPTRRSLQNDVYDTFELSKVIVPRIRYHRLSMLLDHYGAGIEDAHQAFDDAHGAARLLLAMIRTMQGYELPVFDTFERLTEGSGWPFQKLIALAKEQSVKSALSRKVGTQTSSPFLINAQNIIGESQCTPKEQKTPISREKVDRLLDKLSTQLESYEDRPQQRDMCRSVADAFRADRFLVAEAGTGTGKSIAYLIPAILHSVQTGERVIISTNTKNLQEQLFYKDIPTLHDGLGLDFKAVLLKGRSNYICPRRWTEVLDNTEVELTPEERLDLLPIVSWMQETASGDIAECNGFKVHNNRPLWAKVNAEQSNCSARDCANYKNGGCFLHKVRSQASEAHLVIINHSLLFSDLQTDNQILDEFSRLVIDEAHNLERVATEYLGTTLMVWDFRTLSRRLYFKANYGETGQLIKLRKAIAGSNTELGWKNRMQDRVTQAATEAQNLWEEAMRYFRYVTDLLQEYTSRSYRGTYKVRIREGHDIYEEVDGMTKDLKIHLNTLKRSLTDLKEELEEENSVHIENYDRLKQELSGRIIDTQNLLEAIEFFMKPDHENYVYWLESPRRSDSFDTRWRSAPLEVAPLLKEELYDAKKSIIFSSATVTVNNTFDFFNNRVGLSLMDDERVLAQQVGSPFDFRRQALILVPLFLPDSKSKDYAEGVADLLKNVSLLTRRGHLVLFTSYGLLNKVYQLVKGDFESRKLMLLGQGQDGSRSNILNRFKDDTGSVLFGTDSFWEGVDVAGESLEILTITKLPFQVPNEPLVEAHQEVLERKGLSAFQHYMLPNAVLRFRQGFGRLIRRQDDIGLVIITDSRVSRSRYGSVFMNSLPTGYQISRSPKELLKTIKNFFKAADSTD